MKPTDWFRIRHRDPISDDVFTAFQASCAIFKARLEAALSHWSDLPLTSGSGPAPAITFFPPELSGDGRIMSLPIHADEMTVGGRSFIHGLAAQDLHAFLPFPFVAEIDIGITEPSFDDPAKQRSDWWDPHKKRQGIRGEKALQQFGVKMQLPLSRRLKHWLCDRLERWCG